MVRLGGRILSACILGCVYALVKARLMFEELNVSTSYAHHYSKLMDHQNIVMMGDSLMRYQYLSLVYLVHTNSFVPASLKPNILWEGDYGNWNLFYNATNAVFYPNEYCDCYRVSNTIANENRYYYHKERNISIAFIQYQGDNANNKIHGHWSPLDNETNHKYHPPSHGEFIPYHWEADSIHEALFDHVAKLKPKPSVLILNAGLWKNHFADTGHRVSLLNLALSLFDRVIWKTTNFIWKHRGTSSYGICQHPGIECLNLDWTEYLIMEDYRDHVHFQPDIYNDIDIQLILQLTHKNTTAAYVPMDAAFYGKVIQHKKQQYFVDHEGLLRPFALPAEDDAHKSCIEKLNSRTHVDLPAQTLRTHILGNPVDICAVMG